MPINVHLLAKCYSPSRIKSLLLVFRSIRIGFPKANIYVYGNNLDPRILPHLFKAIDRKGILYRGINLIPKGEWIEKLMQSERGPFWICDTDMVFFEPVEHWKFDLFGGRYEPEFIEPWTDTLHMSRLHPSLMYFNPVKLRCAIRSWPGKNDFFFASTQMNLFRWHWVPEIGERLKFYDVCSGLHHSLGGQAFSEEQNKAFEHLFCGSYSHLSDVYSEHRKMQDMAFETPFLMRGLWLKQQQWYSNHKPDTSPNRTVDHHTKPHLTCPDPTLASHGSPENDQLKHHENQSTKHCGNLGRDRAPEKAVCGNGNGHRSRNKPAETGADTTRPASGGSGDTVPIHVLASTGGD